MDHESIIKSFEVCRATNELLLSTEEHLHDYHQLLYLFKGEAEVYLNGKKHLLLKNDFLIIAPLVKHKLIFPVSTPFCDTFQMKIELTKQYSKQLNLGIVYSCRNIKKEMKAVLNLIILNLSNSFIPWEMVNPLLEYLFSLLVTAQKYPTKSTQGNADNRINRALDYINKNRTRQIYVKELAQLVGLNEEYFIKLFNRYVGRTPAQYIIARKMGRIRDMVSFTSEPLLEIAIANGYNNYHHFSSQFKNYFKSSPRTFRKQINLSRGKTQ
jgi:AraC-like DNA-binding protein